MRPVLVCCALMTALSVATIARAQINLAWNDCITQPGSAVDVSYACDGSRAGQPYRLVPSFICPADLPQFVGVQMVIDVTTDSPTLPDWWRLGVGDCRANTLLYPATAEFNSVGSGSTGACRNPWLGGTIGGGSAFYVWTDGTNPPLYTPNRGRIKTAIALQDGVALEHGAQYHAGVLTIETEGDVDAGSGTCAGCPQPACVVLNSVEIYQEFGAPPKDIYALQQPATRQYVTWQGGAIGGAGCPLSVPVRRTTWGSIKATYR